ncbi:MAG: D-alanyl-lipoteichoic acid biosynthesis protein DltD [Oscillospiraceae bacterium]
MKKSLRTALLALLLAALLLGGATALVYASAGDYPDALGLDPEVTEKITGEYLLTAAAAEPDSLIVFGSSELKTTDICTHPANFFAEKRCGFQVDLVGRGSCQSLVHALSIAGSGEALRGKKVVLITAPQSYVEGGIAPDLFMANFSGQQALRMLADDTIPDEIKQYLSSRVQQLMAQYGAEYGAAPEAYTAAGLLTKAVAAENALTQAFLRPYAAVSRWLLDTKDAATAAGIMRAYSDVTTAGPQEIDWDAELEAALSQAQQMATNNDFFMLDGYYSTYVGRKLSQFEGRDADLSYAVSPEYDDLRCLLELCRAKELDVLFVHVPMHGSWNDYTGFTAEKRAAYYEAVREIVTQYDNVTLLDLTPMEYEPYFLCDTMHLGWKGWLEVDRAIVQFYGEN